MIFELGIGKMPLESIASLLGASPCKSSDIPNRIVTNSKEVRAGDLFCALRGKKDGHSYAEEAKKNGAIAVIAERECAEGAIHLLVGDVPSALAAWAHAALQEHPCRRIAITGSVGKTTVKNALAMMLRARYKIHATEGNYNNLLGVSFTVLSMPRESQILIAELGTNHPGEIASLSKIVSPNDAVITCIGHAHIGAFGTIEGIAKEKTSIQAGMTEGGRLFFPNDEARIHSFSSTVTPCPVVPCRRHPILDEASKDCATKTALGFAEALGVAYGLSRQEIENGLFEIARHDVRRTVKHIGGICLIEDAYNASPESVEAALSYLSLHAKKRRIAVLGDMLELGAASHALHREAGVRAAAVADFVFFFGEKASAYLEGALSVRRSCARALTGNASDMAKQIYPYLEVGDTVLFKASRSMRAERIVYALADLLTIRPDGLKG